MDSLGKLPRQIIYDLDVDALNEQYDESNWRIVHWHQHKQLMKLFTPYYTQVVYTPVVSVGLEHDLFTIPYMNPLIDKSAVSVPSWRTSFTGNLHWACPFTDRHWITRCRMSLP